MGKEVINHEKIFNEFWKDLVCNSDGSLNAEQVKKELADFHYIMEQVPKIYCHITGDTLSKLMYSAETVISCANAEIEKQLDETYNDAIVEASDKLFDSFVEDSDITAVEIVNILALMKKPV